MSSSKKGTTGYGDNYTSGTATTTTTKTAEEEKPKKNYTKLLEALSAKGLSVAEFAGADENRRKKILNDPNRPKNEAYQEAKNEADWKYDQPMEVTKELLEQEKALADKKAQAVAGTNK